MGAAAIPESLAAVMRRQMRSALTSAHVMQEARTRDPEDSFDRMAWKTRGRFTEDEITALLLAVDPIVHPLGRAESIVDAAVISAVGDNHGWPSFRAAAIAQTDGALGLAISWRFTVPHRDTVIDEIDNLWAQPVEQPLALPAPRPERAPITEGMTYVHVGASTSIPMHDGKVPTRYLEDALVPRVYTDGGVELLTPAEIAFLARVLQALVDEDRAVLEAVGAYLNDRDPYLWTREHGTFGEVHLTMPPGEPAGWPVDVMQVDTSPGVSLLIVGMWTREEGASDLSLELNLTTDGETGAVSGEFVNLHVM